MKNLLGLTLACVSLGACATSRQTTDAMAITGSAIGGAAAQPLKDLNLVKAQVPEQLKAIVKDPYAKPTRVECAWLEHEVRSLDLALGPDIDLPAQRKSEMTQGSEALAGAAANAVADAAGDLIPFRSVVRRLTGAEKNAAELRQALHAGDVRRAYLKGLGLERGCAYPAAPAPSMASAVPPPALPADPAPSAASAQPTEPAAATPPTEPAAAATPPASATPPAA